MYRNRLFFCVYVNLVFCSLDSNNSVVQIISLWFPIPSVYQIVSSVKTYHFFLSGLDAPCVSFLPSLNALAGTQDSVE